MQQNDIKNIVKLSFVFALIFSCLALAQNTKSMPFSDPWFIPVTFVLLWETFKY